MTTNDAAEPDLDEFCPSSYEAWRAETVAALAGASFEKTLVTRTSEGIDIQPIYHREDLAGLTHLNSAPGQPPYVRGTRTNAGWEIAQEISGESAEALRIENGEAAVNITLDEPARRAGYAVPGRRGVVIETTRDMGRILDGVDLARMPLHIQPGSAALPLFALLICHLRREGADLRALRGALADDPIGELVSRGSLPHSLGAAFDRMALVTRAALIQMPCFRTVGVGVHTYADAGGNAVLELAFALATGIEYLRQLEARGLAVDQAAARFVFAFSIGADFFMALAKLRAARMLWARIIAASGGGAEAQKMRIYARTSLWNRSALDPYVNLLRGATEAFAAVAGGCDSLEVGSFEEVIRPPDEGSRRLARNTQIILREECHFDHVIDPAGGSYYVETLTDQLARKAWTLFREIEKLGGMANAVAAGMPQENVRAVAARKAELVATRRLSVIGANVYANPKEKPLEGHRQSPPPAAAAAHERSAAEARLNKLRKAATEDIIELAVAAAGEGATLGELSSALTAADSERARAGMLVPRRAAEPFERLRAAVEAGGPPKVFLANMGPLRQHKARADFATGFFQAGGFAVIESRAYSTVNGAAEAARQSGAPIVVICSSDETYPEIVPALAARIKADHPGVIIVLAGFPAGHVEVFTRAGVDEFIHISANCYGTLHGIAERLGLVP